MKIFEFNQRKKHRVRRIVKIWLIIMIGGLLCTNNSVFAEMGELPDNVVTVRNEKEMIFQLMEGMEKHKSYFAFYYPGIEEKFRQYQKQSVSYQTFMDKLAKENGYIVGILSSMCISICGVEKKYITFQFSYLTTKKQDKRIHRIARSFANKYKNKNAAYRAKIAQDYLMNKVQYDDRYYSPYYVFTKGRGICMSYALAYQCLMQEMNVPCVYVKGKNHAWNMVKIGSFWYNVDVTWDDACGGYRYFLKADKDFPGHKRPKSKMLSSLKKARRSYRLNKIK